VRTTQRTFAQRVGYLTTCVLPADLLSDERDAEDPSSLRADASRDGLTFVQVHRQLEDDLYLARVAALPALVTRGNGYTVVLSENQLLLARAWDDRLEWEDRQRTRKRCPEAILTLLRAQAAAARPLLKEAAFSSIPPAAPALALTPLEAVEVSTSEVREAFRLVTQDEPSTPTQERRTRQFYFQQALLQAMLDKLMGMLYESQEHTQALILKARCLLVAQLQRWHRVTREGRIVNAVPHFSPERQQMIWRLTVGLPGMAV
jgi:hypothetical protein